MFAWLKKVFTKPACRLCGKQAVEPVPYYDDKGEPVVVCRMCTDYAERRAYRRR